MELREIAYAAEGDDLIGTLAVPDGGPRGPGVLIGHGGYGMTDDIKDRARRLAELGYVAFALDYHGRGQSMPQAEASKRLGVWRTDPSGIRAIAKAGLDILTAQPGVDPARIAAIGYCYGGTMALELARSGADVAAVVGFHSGLATPRPQDAANIKGKILALIGADDPLVPPEQRIAFEEEMRAAKVDWRLVLYGGAVHSFTHPDVDGSANPAIAYHAETDRRSWRAMLDLFAETIGIP
jgi:dienelactone hydrolase